VNTQSLRKPVAIIVVGLAILLSACGGGGKSAAKTSSGNGTPTTASAGSSTAWPAKDVAWLNNECSVNGSQPYDCACTVKWIENNVPVATVEDNENKAEAGQSYQDFITAGEVPACLTGASDNTGNGVNVGSP
jgi:hypothetical protein